MCHVLQTSILTEFFATRIDTNFTSYVMYFVVINQTMGYCVFSDTLNE